MSLSIACTMVVYTATVISMKHTLSHLSQQLSSLAVYHHHQHGSHLHPLRHRHSRQHHHPNHDIGAATPRPWKADHSSSAAAYRDSPREGSQGNSE